MQNKVWYEIKVGTLQVVDVVEGDYIEVSPSRTSEAMPFTDLEFANKVAGQIGGLVQQARWVKFLDPVETVAKDMETPVPAGFDERPINPFTEYTPAFDWVDKSIENMSKAAQNMAKNIAPIFAKVPIFLDGQQIAEKLAADEDRDKWEEILEHIAPLVAIAELAEEALKEEEEDTDPECGCPACLARMALRKAGVKEFKIEELMKDEKQMVKIFPFMSLFPPVFPISKIGDNQE